MNAKKINTLAHRIVIDLFTDGQGRRASRLVMEHDDGYRVFMGGGWCEGAVYDRIRDIITDAVIQELEDRLHGEQTREGGVN